MKKTFRILAAVLAFMLTLLSVADAVREKRLIESMLHPENR